MYICECDSVIGRVGPDSRDETTQSRNVIVSMRYRVFLVGYIGVFERNVRLSSLADDMYLCVCDWVEIAMRSCGFMV